MLSWYVFYLKDDSLPLPPLRLSLSPSWRSSGKGFAANALFFSQYVVSYIFTLKCRNDEWGCALYCCCMPSTDSVQIRSDQSSLATYLLLITLCFFPKWRKKEEDEEWGNHVTRTLKLLSPSNLKTMKCPVTMEWSFQNVFHPSPKNNPPSGFSMRFIFQVLPLGPVRYTTTPDFLFIKLLQK